MGRAAVESLIREREAGGPFASLVEFCHRVLGEGSGVGKGTIETLIQCGAFASLPAHTNRRALVQVLGDAVQSATKAQHDKKAGQGSLADMFGDDDATGSLLESLPIPNMPEFPRDQLLGFERDLLGLSLSDHPLQAHQDLFARRNVTRVSDLSEMPDRTEVMLGGIVTGIKPFTSKKSGEPMAFFNLEDMTGTVACTIFPSPYAQSGHQLEKDKIVLVRGKTSYRDRVREDEEGGHIVEILADEIVPVASGGASLASRIIIHLDPTKREALRFIRETVEQNRGNGGSLPVHLRVPEGDTMHEVRTELLAEFTEPFRAALERLLGRQSVWME